MTRKLREFKRSFGQEKARVKLYKSGKNWVKAGIKEIQLLRLMGLPFLTEKVEKDVEGPQNIGGFIKRNALKTTALTGGMFSVNMLHDQNAFAASEAPVTSELTTQSQTVGDQTSVVIEQSQSSTDSQSATSTASETSTLTASESNTSENSQSTSADSQSTSTKDSTSTNDKSTTSESVASESTLKSDSKSEVTSQEATSTSQSTTSQTSTSENSASTSLSTLNSTSTNTNTSLRSVSLRAATTSFATVAATAPVTQTFTGAGTDTQYNIPIYYKLIVNSDGSKMNFTYYISYDNPNTTTIEKAPAGINQILQIQV
ncbi:KxYKxGKxW signal peptide domain-containing protein [Staphylococcus agnetis]|uniref:KxYKxGKxW signal peptide domain-containing protein n=1 Tax=Staphylococcus agnetis TaxID=985762 RepID=UPI000CD2C9DA|nr:KxYKxGKxW signal peptide domain-containing protein [Staphylococcus agnetis]MBY7664285.1 KxYKxGKxW signal peptide domain-containing protein [Staphylococcus agnetis]NJH68601.1 hypothetical protein [Staphylococcus agnetis]NJH79507.1 hypothetical protein [Staphylococcus agnetis]PNY87267.1 hypothetical protein CD172_02830 [Staphylococcus agnetis]PTH67896.1 hypothetical protein BU582_04825 [Staphylococcus agnetis]